MANVKADRSSEHMEQQEQDRVPKRRAAVYYKEYYVEEEKSHLEDREPKVHSLESIEYIRQLEGGIKELDGLLHV